MGASRNWVAAVALLVGCGGGDGSSYLLGGSVSGLDGAVVLQNNGGDDLTITSDGSFTFATEVEDQAEFAVTIRSQPVGQTCTVMGGTGAVDGADVASVELECGYNSYAVGGTVTGIDGGEITLQNNGGDDLTLTSDGTFVFAGSLDHGQSYEVTLSASSLDHHCTVSSGSGAVSAGDVTDVEVACTVDVAPPTVDAFAIVNPNPTSTSPLSIAMSASDDYGIAGYLVTESSTPPDASDFSSASPITSFTPAGGIGRKVLYAWALDVSGNVSVETVTASIQVVDTGTASQWYQLPIYDDWLQKGVNDIWFADAQTVFIAGDNGLFMKTEDGGATWDDLAFGLPASAYFYGVWGTDASNVFVVGSDGLIYHWNGTTLSKQSSGTGEWLYRVWGIDGDTIWVAGEGSTLLEWNGTGWDQVLTVPYGGARATGIFATTADSLWLTGIVSGQGFWWYWDGAEWSDGSLPVPQEDLWGLDENNIWSVGQDGNIHYFDGDSWSLQDEVTSNTLYEIWGLDGDNVWAGGIGGELFKFNGTDWNPEDIGTAAGIYALSGYDIDHIWLVASTLRKRNGSSWEPIGASKPGFNWEAMRGLDAQHIWTVGGAGMIAFFDGWSWSFQDSGTEETLNALWPFAADNVWAVGDNGAFLKFDGMSWAAHPNPPAAGIYARGIWAVDENNVWVADADKKIWYFNGTDWSSTATAEFLFEVWGLDADNIWVAGANGFLTKWDGDSWNVQTTPATNHLYSIWATDPNNVYVGGWIEMIHWDGDEWLDETVPESQIWYGMIGFDANTIYAVGTNGKIIHWNGGEWVSQDTGVTRELHGVWGADANVVWVSGAGLYVGTP